jgi:hypothetical protein
VEGDISGGEVQRRCTIGGLFQFSIAEERGVLPAVFQIGELDGWLFKQARKAKVVEDGLSLQKNGDEINRRRS